MVLTQKISGCVMPSETISRTRIINNDHFSNTKATMVIIKLHSHEGNNCRLRSAGQYVLVYAVM